MIKNLEDLIVWQKSRELNRGIYKVIKFFPSFEKTNLISQIIRAANSVCANIAEGFGRYNAQESIQFYRTARGSLIELKSHLYIAFDQEYISHEQLRELLLQVDEIGRMLSGFITSTRKIRTNVLSSKNQELTS